MALIDLIAALIGVFLFGHVARAPYPATPVNSEVGQQAAVNQTSPNTQPGDQATSPTDADKIEKLAKCLSEKGVKMYGAYWCPHCQNQKKAFGQSFKFISYQECDAKGENGSPTICQKAGVQGYPTWIFADGNKLEGEQSFEDLAKASNCEF